MERRKFDENAVDDLVLMKRVSEEALVDTLQTRFKRDEIYTYIGEVLVSVNPFTNIRGMYDRSLMQKYNNRYRYELAPHVFASADAAYRQLMSYGVDQCILVSGESGAGKTEAAKKLMEFVAEVSDNIAELGTGDKSVKDIKDALLKSNPVLEAFGNAKTLRNDNSSRFGKYMEIQMDYNGTPLGGRITNYLLEKPRVVHQTPGERNFHVFYLLCAGADRSLQNDLMLNDAGYYRILAESGSVKVKGIDDVEFFNEMDDGMAGVGIGNDMKMQLFAICSGIMWLGNVEFKTSKRGAHDACAVANQEPLRNAAQLFQVTPKQLEAALTTRTRSSGLETVKSPIPSVEECEKVRDALSKALYARMFQRLVDMINETIYVEGAELNLGVLDIYGFEIFDHNSFEQLCINYCNEKLQQYFIELTLRKEQEEYRREGIQWTDIKYFNNKIVCDLIEAKNPAGVIAYLNEESIYPKGTDMSLLKKMNTNLSRHPHYESLETRTQNDVSEFLIHHYAGDVKYSVKGMLAKNKDQLYRDLLVLCGAESQSRFISDMFPEGREKQTSKRPPTAGTQFTKDMQVLIETLSKCEPHYIRCIKSNDKKRAGLYDVDRVVHQVRYLGLLENVRVRRAGFAYRREFDLFVRRYKMLTPDTWPHANGNDRANVQWILSAIPITQDGYQMGKTKVFIKAPEDLFKMEALREERMHYIVTIVQRAYRSWKSRLYFQQIREKSVQLFANNKRRRKSWVLYFIGDYLKIGQNPVIRQLLEQHGDRNLLFSDYVELQTLGKKPKKETGKVLAVAQGALLVLNSDYSLHTRIPYGELNLLGMSTYADGWMVIQRTPQRNKKDVLEEQPTLLLHSLRKAEIATVMVDAYQERVSQEIPLKFADSFNIWVMAKKGFFSKKAPQQHQLKFSEDSRMSPMKYIADFAPQRTKKDPGFDKSVDPFLHEIYVSPLLGSQADLSLDDGIPDRVLEHTQAAHAGKKRRNNRRRRNY